MSTLDRRRFLLTAAGAAVAACSSAPRQRNLRRGEACDLLLRGGRVFDGSGGAPFFADIAVRGDRIVGIGAYAPADAKEVLDLGGLCLSPGFVDIHTHSDRSILRFPGAESRVRQGVTTEITGNCGSSAAPRGPEDESAPWRDVASYGKSWTAAKPAIHHALLVGHGTLRSIVIGDVDRPATSAELQRMSELLDEALRQGAIGMSTGLEYVPGIYTPAAEIEALARVVARHGGLYASHMRSEEEELLQAVDEALAVGRNTGVRVQVSHLKACGRANWPLLEEAIARIERARGDGVDVMADAYPYTAYSTTLTILLEPWSREGGAEAVVARLRNPEQRARMRAEVGPHVAGDPGGFELVVIASVADAAHQACVGRSITEIAAMWGVEPADAFLRLLEENAADVGFIGHGIAAEGVNRVLAHPLVMVGSDGRTMAPVPRQIDRPHPRSYGSFPRVLGVYCREQGLFDLPTAIAKMTSMPAERARLRDRGRIAVGMYADLVAFDAATVRDGATFAEPQRYPEGIPHVVVAGRAVVRDGADTGARPGRWLAHGR
ncbi:MAG: hypothetical protein RL398_1504 [Planctomycetota bacterium]